MMSPSLRRITLESSVFFLIILPLFHALKLSHETTPMPSITSDVSLSPTVTPSPGAMQTSASHTVSSSASVKPRFALPTSRSPSPSTSPSLSPTATNTTVNLSSSPAVTPTAQKRYGNTSGSGDGETGEAVSSVAMNNSAGSTWKPWNLSSSYSRSGGQLSLLEKIAQTRSLFGLRKVEPSSDARRVAALFTDRYLTWHRQHRYDKKTPRLIFRLRGPQPGLGDRLTGLISVLVYAVATRRLLLIDWPEPFPLQDVFSVHRAALFAVEDDFTRAPPSSMTCTNGKCIDAMLTSSVHTIFFNATAPMKAAGFLRLVRKHGKDEDVKFVQTVNDTTMITGPDGPTFALMLNAAFRLTSQFADFFERQAGTLLRGEFVAVHARLGKGVLEGGKRFIDVDEDCVAHMLAEAGVRKAYEEKISPPSLFLATDTPGFRGQFRTVAKQSGAENVFMGVWETKHVARMNKENDHDRKLFWLSVVDLLLIGRARAVVGMGSRFANVGAFLGGTDAHIAIGLNGECGSWVIGTGKW